MCIRDSFKDLFHFVHEAFLFLLFSFVFIRIVILVQGIACQLIELSESFFGFCAQALRCLNNKRDIMIASHLRVAQRRHPFPFQTDFCVCLSSRFDRIDHISVHSLYTDITAQCGNCE